jgi:insulysin
MMFLGSKKYPGQNDLESFLSDSGGYSNAFTEYETTTYHFEVNNSSFEKALDMFSSMFVSPLFTED